MIRRKYRERLNHVFGLVLVALVINLTLPNTKIVKAQTVPTSDSGNSHSVIVQPPASRDQISLPTLPTVPDKPPVVKKTLVVRASAYTSTRAETDSDPFTTASGTKVKDGIIAMNGMPFGTKVRLPEAYGGKIFVVQDRMNAKWGTRRIDIWMPNRHQAIDWGVRTVKIEIVK